MSSQPNIVDEFHKDDNLADVVFVVEDYKIPVCKSVLCIASPVFYKMFDDNFQEKTKKEVPLPGKKCEDFLEFLRCIYPNKMKKLTAENVYMLLPLAHEYQVEKMIKDCEQVLIPIVLKSHTDDVEELYHHVLICEMYGLEELKEICIYLASEHKLSQFKASKEKHKISEASHQQIIEFALRRHELNKDDNNCFHVVNAEKRQELSEDVWIGVITLELKGRIGINENDNISVCRAMRIVERFKFKNQKIKSDLVKKLKDDFDSDEDMEDIEEFYLLPAKFKNSLKRKY